ncbi:MAG: pyridoxal-phosphate dependent enzyme [Anaerolineales bacterium]|nr:pyridoxal-phosphate dependent enzyme [Anaerolineales bacterium]
MDADLYPGACSACGSSWLSASYDLDALPKNWPERVSRRSTNLWRYRELLPFPDEMKLVSMGEGWTPMTRAEGLEAETGHKQVWIKDERQQPTGSFKDRQAACAVSALKSRGIDELVLSSTGNAAAAYAAFCARAGIKLWVFLTSSVPAEKMRELALYGAEVVKITGTYDQAKEIAADFAARRGIYYDTGAKAIPNKESMKTVAFEIVEQLGWRAPDWYIQAVSGGLGPLGVLKGFEELYAVGLIDRVPKIGVVQSEGCAPMANAWEKGLDEAEPVVPDTLITVLSTGKPGVAYKVLKQASDKYGGVMVSVSDGDAFRAMRKVARVEGFSTEPAASVAFAGFDKMIEKGYIDPDECVVINCSGHTFSAEKHALEDRYVVDLNMEVPQQGTRASEGLDAALKELDEQVTSIVIIDDNPHDSRLIRRLLQRYKRYRVFEAHNGPDGIDLVRQRRPELVVLDLTIPGMDGFAILDELKKDERTDNIPVMIISGKDLTPDQHDFLDRTAQSIWQKGSFSGPELVNHVVETLGDEEIQHLSGNGGKVAVKAALVKEFGEDTRPQILVVDDNIWDARLMRKLFEARSRFQVVEVHSAEEALQKIEQAVPELIVLDLVLPQTSGQEFLEILREREETRRVPVVVVSAKELDIEAREKISMNAVSLWSKEMLDRNSLLAHIEDILAE